MKETLKFSFQLFQPQIFANDVLALYANQSVKPSYVNNIVSSTRKVSGNLIKVTVKSMHTVYIPRYYIGN
jgi:hypothetical protein